MSEQKPRQCDQHMFSSWPFCWDLSNQSTLSVIVSVDSAHKSTSRLSAADLLSLLLQVCTSCGVKGQQHAPDFGTGCVYCIMSECDSCYDARRKAHAAADAALAAAGPYKHAFVVAGGGLCSLCHAHADTAHLSWYKVTLSVEQLDKVHARVKLTDVQRRYFLNSKRTNVWRLDRLPDDYIQIKAIRSSGEKAMDYYIVPPVACGARDY